MSASKPVARTKADQPAATRHLSSGEVEALELTGEAEHAIGSQREELTDAATRREKHAGHDRGTTRAASK